MRWILILPLVAFAVTLAVLIGQRLSTDALAILLGVAIGVAAGLPGQWLLYRRTPTSPAPLPACPPSSLRLPASPALPVPRSFVVVGEEAAELPSPIIR
jgi:hypothetical protein